jgi:DnaJ family protein B protein 6
MDNLMSNIFSASTAFSNVGFGMGGMGMGMGMGMGLTPMNRHRRTFSTSMNMGSVSRGGGGGNWASESTMSQTINGVTQTIKKRRDWDGNEYVTRTYPDGRKVVTINGVVQSESDQGHIPPPTNRNYLPPSGSPPPPYSPRNYAESSERPVIPVTPNFSAANYNNDEGMPSHPKSSRKRWWDRT